MTLTSITKTKFHAWKKPLLATGVAGVLLLSMSGCAGISDAIDNKLGPSTECVGETFGQAVGVELIEDDYGTYCKIGASEETLKYDASKVDMKAIKAVGWTEEDAKMVWEDTMTHVFDNVIDSPYLQDYYSEELGEKLYKENSEHIDSDYWETTVTRGFVMSDFPFFTRGDNPRVFPDSLTMQKVYVELDQVQTLVQGTLFLQMDKESAEAYLAEISGIDGAAGDYLDETDTGNLYQVPISFNYNLAYSIDDKPTSDAGLKWSGASWKYDPIEVQAKP